MKQHHSFHKNIRKSTHNIDETAKHGRFIRFTILFQSDFFLF